MSNRRLSDASQAELGITAIIGTSVSFTPTANSGWITSSNTNYSTARAGSNLTLSSTNTARVGYAFDGTTHILYQTLLEFNVSIPSNAIVASATLRIQYTTPATTELFTLEASNYNYGAIESVDFVAGSTLPPSTKFGQTAIPINPGFTGDIVSTKTFDDIDTLRNLIISSGTYRFLIYPTKSKDTSGSIFPVSNYTSLSISSCTLTITYVTAGEVIAALIGAYWGIYMPRVKLFIENTTINHRIEMTSTTNWSEVTNGTGTAITYGANVVPVSSILGIYRLTDPKTGTISRSSTEIFMDFDTSSIPDSELIRSATLKIGYIGSYIQQDFPSILSDEIEVYAYDFGTSVDVVDFRNQSWLNSATKVASIAAPTSGTPSILTLTSNGSNFINAINKTGSTRLVVTTKQFRTKTSESFDFQYTYYIGRNVVGAGLEVTY